jgi:hypothetical protein
VGLAAGAQQQAHAPGTGGVVACQRLQASLHGSGVERHIEMRRRALQARQVLGRWRNWPSTSARVSSRSNGALARSTKARLWRHSLHSASAVAPEVMPLPMPQVAVVAPSAPARSTTVRMGTLKVAATLHRPSGPATPAGRTTPTAPQYTPRGADSSARIICMARTLGAPVTEPQGNSAANTSESRMPARVRACTSDVICHTVGRPSVWNSAGTRTLCGWAMRERSLRSRSTIMTFSARSLGDARRWAAWAASSAGVAPRAAVPFMGRARMRPPPGASCQSKNSSGETDSTCSGPAAMCAA